MAKAKTNVPAVVATAPKFDVENVPMTDTRGVKIEKMLIPNDSWATGILIDAEAGFTQTDRAQVVYTFAITGPRIYEGISLQYRLHAGLVNQFDPTNKGSLAELFPGVDMLNADAAWEALGHGIRFRIHVGQVLLTDRETGEVKRANRVVSFRFSERDRA